MFSALSIHRQYDRVRQTHGLSFRKTLDAGTDQQLSRRESRYGNAFPIQSFTDLNRHGPDRAGLLIHQPHMGLSRLVLRGKHG